MLRWIVLVFVALTAPADAAQSGSLVIDTAGGPQRFRIELATTPEQMAIGLMYRQSLPADAGMLFVYPSEQPVAFWMKNTFIPLDMLFIGADGRIRRIVERTVPLSTTPISSVDAVRAVLEINGGTAERLGIKPGDVVRHGSFWNGG
ncbi:MAG TPA: DUF192 domain-containing protein [Dongiaceae bacterium]|nr:DUF192 domain-containing protein [Dongiaceae bacterium]